MTGFILKLPKCTTGKPKYNKCVGIIKNPVRNTGVIYFLLWEFKILKSLISAE